MSLLLFQTPRGFSLDFTGGQLPERCTFARASKASRLNGNTIDFVGSDVPRLSASGILIEPQRTCAALWSGEVYGRWSTASAAMAVYGSALLGAFVAPAVVASTGAAWQRAYTSVGSLIGGTTYAFVAYYKGGTSGRCRVGVRNETTLSESLFAGTNGSLAPSSNAAGQLSLVQQDALGGGIYRVYGTFVPLASNLHTLLIGPDSAKAGDNVVALGGQLEAGTQSTSFIATSGAQGTRAADLLTLDVPSGISSLIYTFDDDSTQQIAATVGAYTVPTNLNRPTIKRIMGVA